MFFQTTTEIVKSHGNVVMYRITRDTACGPRVTFSVMVANNWHGDFTDAKKAEQRFQSVAKWQQKA
jgi:hypothetical protein